MLCEPKKQNFDAKNEERNTETVYINSRVTIRRNIINLENKSLLEGKYFCKIFVWIFFQTHFQQHSVNLEMIINNLPCCSIVLTFFCTQLCPNNMLSQKWPLTLNSYIHVSESIVSLSTYDSAKSEFFFTQTAIMCLI